MPAAVGGILRLLAGLFLAGLFLAGVVLLCSGLQLAVKLAVGGTAARVQPIGDVFEGALDGGHQRLNSLQLLRGRVDGGVLRHDVAVIVTEGTERPLGRRRKKSEIIFLCGEPAGALIHLTTIGV